MNVEIAIEWIYAIIAIGTVLSGIAAWIFRRGRKEGIDESCAQRIEGKLDGLSSKLDSEIKNTDESHRQIHEKINNLGKEMFYIKGKLDQHLKTTST